MNAPLDVIRWAAIERQKQLGCECLDADVRVRELDGVTLLTSIHTDRKCQFYVEPARRVTTTNLGRAW